MANPTVTKTIRVSLELNELIQVALESLEPPESFNSWACDALEHWARETAEPKRRRAR